MLGFNVGTSRQRAATGMRWIMRRIIAECGLVVSLVIALATALIWVDALSWRALEEPLASDPRRLRARAGESVFVYSRSWAATGNQGPR